MSALIRNTWQPWSQSGSQIPPIIRLCGRRGGIVVDPRVRYGWPREQERPGALNERWRTACGAVFVNACMRMLPVCDRVQCLYVTPCLFSLWYLLSVQDAWANKQPTYWCAAAWNMHSVFAGDREKRKGKREREQSKSVKESIMRCPNREHASTMALLMAQCQGAAGQ